MAHFGITIGSLGAKQSSEKGRKGAVGSNGLGNVDPFSLASWVVSTFNDCISTGFSSCCRYPTICFISHTMLTLEAFTCSSSTECSWCHMVRFLVTAAADLLHYAKVSIYLTLHRSASVFMQA